jgi:CO/xanthine dehydrogenase FAD-binding subunit
MENKEGERTMIAFDFNYYKPSTIAEALETYATATNLRKKVIYYSGGTEFITFARMNKMHADVVIDIKGIPECNVCEIQGGHLIIGATISLNKLVETNLFPLLSQTVKQIANHSSRNKITIGGNINSQLIYREGVLPFLLTDAKVKIALQGEERVVLLEKIFDRKMTLEEGAFLVQIIVDSSFIDLPFLSLKRTKMTKVGYPVVSLAALLKENQIRVAFSGLCSFPFRSRKIETIVNNDSLSESERIEQIASHLPAPVVDDLHASAAYRGFVLKNLLVDTFEVLEGKK